MVSDRHNAGDGPTDRDRNVIRALASELLEQLPALRDLEKLVETIHHVRQRDGEPLYRKLNRWG